MQHMTSSAGIVISYEKYGNGPSLLLVHGSFSDHQTNWMLVKSLLAEQFTVYAIARRGRGDTDATEGHSVENESSDVEALLGALDEPAFLLGHSYGGHVALAAAARIPDGVRKLVLYEAPWPHILRETQLAKLEELARRDDWDGVAMTFFSDILDIPPGELEELRASELWQSIAADARATLGDLRALGSYDFAPERFDALGMPVMLQVGTESPRSLYVTDALAAVLPDVQIETLPGQAHEGMLTAPEYYAESVIRFFKG
jgi:pimeloyl-ACP methyl ester carboxylesterase